MYMTDDGFNDSDRTLLCGLIHPTEQTKTISFFNILHAEFSNGTLTVKYVKPKSNKKNARLLVRTLIYSVSAPADLAERWTEQLMDKAYGPAQRNKRIKVLINPYGGAGKAQSLYDRLIAPIYDAAGCITHVERTTHQGHAIDIAEQLDINAYDVLACASGDGLPYECFNGLGKKANAAEALRKIAIVQLPCGTGNAMSWNLFGTGEPSVAALCTVKGVRSPLDLASVTQGDDRTISFLSQSVGIVAETDLGTDNIRWMGDLRFTFGFLVRLLGKTTYPVDYAVRTEIEGKDNIKRHYAKEMVKRQGGPASYEILDKNLETQTHLGLPPLKYGTIKDPLPKDENSGWTRLESYHNLGNFYCGNMCYMAADAPFFPASLPDDGLLDLVNIDGDISRVKAVKLLLSVENGGLFEEDIVRFRKISAVRVIPKFGRPMTQISEQEQTATGVSVTSERKPSVLQKVLTKIPGLAEKPGYFAVDGEKLPFEPFQIEIHRGLGTVLSRVRGTYQFDGPINWRDFQAQPSQVKGPEVAQRAPVAGT